MWSSLGRKHSTCLLTIPILQLWKQRHRQASLPVQCPAALPLFSGQLSFRGTLKTAHFTEEEAGIQRVASVISGCHKVEVVVDCGLCVRGSGVGSTPVRGSARRAGEEVTEGTQMYSCSQAWVWQAWACLGPAAPLALPAAYPA